MASGRAGRPALTSRIIARYTQNETITNEALILPAGSERRRNPADVVREKANAARRAGQRRDVGRVRV